ncbi:MAG: glycogen synthase [Clostridiales bacterium]|nr:glycogen synthase [Clostridiales bacterium]
MKKILYAAAECDPFIKTGGLGSVVGSLPKELRRKGYDVRIVIPAYQCMDEQWKSQMTSSLPFPVYMGWGSQPAVVRTLVYEGIPCYFVSNDFYFSGNAPYREMWQDIEKFSFFCKAVLEMLAYLDFEPDVIHCHDWQTGLIPVFLKTFYGENPYYRNIKTVMTLHNMRFQGTTDINVMKGITGLPYDLFTYDKLESYGSANMLKGGIVYADKITTVSSTYAQEIQEPALGKGLDGALRYRSQDLSGIVNGIDYAVYDPSGDAYISYHYDSSDFREGKKKNKAALQKEAGLPEDGDVFAACIISRLTDQKGLDILEPVLHELLQQNVQLFVLGGGEKRFEEMFTRYKERYPDKIYASSDYNDRMAKLMYAGCDATIMPSRFEPCGLSQLMALRYGTVPIVRLTGGLKDTVMVYDAASQTGTGFGFEEYSSAALRTTMKHVLDVFRNHPDEWNAIAERGMKEDYSWSTSSEQYADLYETLLG